MDFRQVKTLNIPEGNVTKITDSNGVVIWEKGNNEPDLPTPLNNEIYYTSTDGNIIVPYRLPTNNTLISNTYNNGVGKLVFENDLVEIVVDMFYFETRLKTIQLPNSITIIKDGAFWQCPLLEVIYIPESVNIIESNVFGICHKLKNIKIPQAVTVINYATFVNCTSLEEITLHNNITSIEEGAFSGCTSLKQITLNDNITSIGSNAFSGCTSLTTIDLPSSINKIDDFTFSSCSSLISITIPEGVKSIGDSAFYGCTSLKQIIIPDSVNSLTFATFKNNYNLATIYSLNPNAPSGIERDTFTNVGSNVEGEKILYVPKNSTRYEENWLPYLEGFELQYITE